MSLYISVILIMLFIIVYVAILKIFSVLFQMTGLTREKSKFQSISLFTAVGYSTKESEIITNDRTRRRIATACMITGNVFSVIIVSLIVNVISNFSWTHDRRMLIIMGVAFAVFLLILIVFQIPALQRRMAKLIEKIMRRTLNKDKTGNILTLLDSYGDNAIVEIFINNLPEIFNGKSIFESGLKKDYGINILMLKRKDHAINITRDTMIQKRDEIVVFGSYAEIKELFSKTAKEARKEEAEKNKIELIDNFHSAAMMSVHVAALPAVMKDKTLEECKLKALYGINVLMVKRGEEVVEVKADTRILTGDEIILFGPYHNILYLFSEEGESEMAEPALN